MAQREEAGITAKPQTKPTSPQTQEQIDLDVKIKSQFFEEKRVDEEVVKGLIQDRKGEQADMVRLESRFMFEEDHQNMVVSAQTLKHPTLTDLKVNEAMEFDAQTKTLVKGCCGSSVKTQQYHVKVAILS